MSGHNRRRLQKEATFHFAAKNLNSEFFEIEWACSADSNLQRKINEHQLAKSNRTNFRESLFLAKHPSSFFPCQSALVLSSIDSDFLAFPLRSFRNNGSQLVLAIQLTSFSNSNFIFVGINSTTKWVQKSPKLSNSSSSMST